MEAESNQISHDVLVYMILPMTRRRELCFLRASCQQMRRSVMLPVLVLSPRSLAELKRANEDVSDIVNLSHTAQLFNLNGEDVALALHLLQQSTTLTSISAELSATSYGGEMNHDGLEPLPQLQVDVGVAMAKILKLPHKLEHLDLSNIFLGAPGISHLADGLNLPQAATSIRHLSLSRTVLRGFAARVLFPKISYVTKLDISSNLLELTGCKALAELIRSSAVLEELDVSCSLAKEEHVFVVMEAIKSSGSLRRLSARCCTMTPKAGDAIADMLRANTVLTALDLVAGLGKQFNPTPAIVKVCEAVASSTTLSELRMCDFGDDGLLALSKCLEENKSLLKLDLYGVPSDYFYLTIGNRFTAASVPTFFLALKANSTLRDLSITLEAFMEDAPVVVKSIASMLGTNSTLKSLKIASRMLDVGADESFLGSLAKNSGLTSLSLHEMTSTAPGDGQSLLRALKSNTILRCLHFENCPGLRQVLAAAIPAVLPNHPSLEQLTLMNCNFSMQDSFSVINSLKTNKTLRSLKMSKNVIRTAGAQALAGILAVHPSLCVIDLSNGEIGAEGLRQIIKVCETTATVSEIHLHGNLSGAMHDPPESIATVRNWWYGNQRRKDVLFAQVDPARIE